MADGVRHLKPEHYKNHTIFSMRTKDDRKYPVGGIIVKGIHQQFKAVNDMSIHVHELYNFRNKEALIKKAKDVIDHSIKKSSKYPQGFAVWGNR